MTDWIPTIHALMAEIGGTTPSVKMTNSAGKTDNPTGYATVGSDGKIARASKKGDYLEVEDAPDVIKSLQPMLELDGFVVTKVGSRKLHIRHKK